MLAPLLAVNVGVVEPRWTSPIIGSYIGSSPVVDPNNASVIYIAAEWRPYIPDPQAPIKGGLAAIDTRTGAVLWHYKDSDPGTNPEQGYSSTPVVGTNSTVFVQDNINNGRVYAIRGGEQLWAYDLGGQQTGGMAPALSADGATLYALGQRTEMLYAIHARDGSTAWQLKVPGLGPLLAVSVDGADVVYVTKNTGGIWIPPKVLAVDRSGKIVWTSSQLAGHPGNLRVSSTDGSVIASHFSTIGRAPLPPPSTATKPGPPLVSFDVAPPPPPFTPATDCKPACGAGALCCQDPASPPPGACFGTTNCSNLPGPGGDCIPKGQCIPAPHPQVWCCPGNDLAFDPKCGIYAGIPNVRCVDASAGATQAVSLAPGNGSEQREWDTQVKVDDGLTLLPDNVLLLGTEGAGSSGRSPNSIVRLQVVGGAAGPSALYNGTTDPATRADNFDSGAVATPDGSLYAHDGMSLYRWKAAGPPVWSIRAPTDDPDLHKKQFAGTPALSPRADVMYVVLNPSGDAITSDGKLLAYDLSRVSRAAAIGYGML